jgi:3-oxoacyl-[acyl-carrier protein] reductase
MSKLEGKVAVVTGASKGIGAGVAKALAAAGAAVVVNYSNSKAGADAVVAAIEQGSGKAIAVQADLSDPAQAQKLINAAIEQYGQLDILVNNSGIYEFQPLEAITPEHFHRHFDLNVLGLLMVSQAAAKHLREGGSIINISTAAVRLTPPGSSVYTATKAAVEAITGVLAKEFGPKKIRVNTVSPGMVETEGTHAGNIIGSDFEQWAVQQTPLGRVGQPDDIADVVVFLASNDARWLTGENLLASGGLR